MCRAEVSDVASAVRGVDATLADALADEAVADALRAVVELPAILTRIEDRLSDVARALGAE